MRGPREAETQSCAQGIAHLEEEAAFYNSHKAVLCINLRISELEETVFISLTPAPSDLVHCR